MLIGTLKKKRRRKIEREGRKGRPKAKASRGAEGDEEKSLPRNGADGSSRETPKKDTKKKKKPSQGGGRSIGGVKEERSHISGVHNGRCSWRHQRGSRENSEKKEGFKLNCRWVREEGGEKGEGKGFELGKRKSPMKKGGGPIKEEQTSNKPWEVLIVPSTRLKRELIMILFLDLGKIKKGPNHCSGR